jgi:hypothetical protein
MKTCFTIDEVLDRVVRAITNKRLGVYDQPRLSLGLEHIAGMKIRNE